MNFPVRAAHSRELFTFFVLLMHDVTTSKLLHEAAAINYGCEAVEALCFVLSHIT